MESRTKNTLRNTAFAVGAQLLTQILNFVNRTIFIYFLGVEYLGVSGLFSNVLSILSLAELGIGSAIIYNLYKPIANNDLYKTKQLLNFYKSAYRIIIVVIIILGLLLIPFMDILIKNKPNIPHLTMIYLLYLAGTVSTYVVAHKRSFITASQKDYINTVNRQIFAFVQVIIDALVLIFTKDFILYLSLRVIVTLVSNWRLSYRVDKLYPDLKTLKVSPIDKQDKKNIFKYIRAMMYHSIGGVAILSTSNLLISAFVGVIAVGVYSNYLLIIGLLVTVVNMFFNSAIGSVGNLNATGDVEKSYIVFRRMFFMNALLYAICAVCLFILVDDFIMLWLGENFILDKLSVVLIVANFYMINVRNIVLIFRNTSGLFYQDRFRPLIAAAVNLFFSILLLKLIGLPGVFLGAFISTACITFWMEPWILFKYGFKRKLMDYFRVYIKFVLAALLSVLISMYFKTFFSILSWFSWLSNAIITTLISFSIIILIFRKSEELKFWHLFILDLIQKLKIKIGGSFKQNI